jgi:hypothetical protein
MAVLVSRLQAERGGRLVVDQTGLDGFYRFELRLFEPSVRPPLPVQLRMRIENTRALVDVAIVDAISMPTPN